MNKLLLLLIFFFPVFSKAQTSVYHPFGVDGAVWRMQWTNYCLFTPCYFQCYTDYQYRIEGDTMLSSITYKKVMKEGYDIVQCFCNGNLGQCTTSAYSSNFFCGIREDSITRRSFINDGWQPEQLLYDFNLNVNDTMHGAYCNGYVIAGIDSILIGGNYRKDYIINVNTKVIEGIGFVSNGFDGAFNSDFPCVCNDFWEFVCYSLDGTVLYGDTNCTVLNNVKGIKKNSFSISPNPAHDRINVECKMQNAELKIYDMMGREVMEEKIHSPLSTFSFQLPGGVYFVRVSDGEKMAVQKLVVE